MNEMNEKNEKNDDHEIQDELDDDGSCGCPSRVQSRGSSKTIKKRNTNKASAGDSAKPKRAPNAFMIYSQVQRRQHYRGSTLKVTDIAKEIGSKWQALSEEEKSQYKKMAVDQQQALRTIQGEA